MIETVAVLVALGTVLGSMIGARRHHAEMRELAGELHDLRLQQKALQFDQRRQGRVVKVLAIDAESRSADVAQRLREC